VTGIRSTAGRRPHARGVAVTLGRSPGFRRFYLGVVIVQGVHLGEHVLQLVQVHLFGVPDDDALGLLGYVFELHGTEEWLHLVFNVSYLAALFVVLIGVVGLYRSGRMAWWALALFAVYGVGLESWHLIEHGVIIANVIRNEGCPCPGIGDAALGVTDTNLHFLYNAVTYAGALVPWPTIAAGPVDDRRSFDAEPMTEISDWGR
jgi:hypothetical protein